MNINIKILLGLFFLINTAILNIKSMSLDDIDNFSMLPNGDMITYDNKIPKLWVKEDTGYKSYEEYTNLSYLQVNILLKNQSNIEVLLKQIQIFNATTSLVKFAKKFSEDKKVIEYLESLLTKRQISTKKILDDILPKDIQNICCDYLDMYK